MPKYLLLHRFNASHVIGAPVEINDHGLLNYRADLMGNQPDEDEQMRMWMVLGWNIQVLPGGARQGDQQGPPRVARDQMTADGQLGRMREGRTRPSWQ